MYTAAQFIEGLLGEFPDLREDVECEAGLLHNQMHCFTRLTNEAIRAGDFDAVSNHFAFVDRFFHHSADELENAWYVSYLEDLDFAGTHGQSAQALMSSALRQGWRDIMNYLDEVMRRADAEKHGSPNA